MMTRKAICLLVILGLILLTSCYSRRIVKHPKDATPELLSKYTSFFVKTNEGNKHKFKEMNIITDGFEGATKDDQKIELKEDNIKYIRMTKFNSPMTVIVSILGAAAIIGLVSLIAIAHSMGGTDSSGTPF